MLRRRAAVPALAAQPEFAEWLIRQFASDAPTAGMPFAAVERFCANACSLLIGAAFAHPEALPPPADRATAEEARLIARRTADGFKASLADRQHTVIAWPWDHVATAAAWAATRSGDTSAHALSEGLAGVSLTYAAHHRQQLTAVLDLWKQVAGNLHPDRPAPDLVAMGAEMFDAYRAASTPAVSSQVG